MLSLFALSFNQTLGFIIYLSTRFQPCFNIAIYNYINLLCGFSAKGGGRERLARRTKDSVLALAREVQVQNLGVAGVFHGLEAGEVGQAVHDIAQALGLLGDDLAVTLVAHRIAALLQKLGRGQQNGQGLVYLVGGGAGRGQGGLQFAPLRWLASNWRLPSTARMRWAKISGSTGLLR